MISLLSLNLQRINVVDSCPNLNRILLSFGLVRFVSLILVLGFYFQQGYAGVENNKKLPSDFTSCQAKGGINESDATLASVMVNPDITVRFSNPQFDCNTDKYCLDVEFKSNLANQELFGMNVRFWYDDSVLELVNFTGFLGGYGPVAPNPPTKSTSASAGPAWFLFVGAAEFINGAVQLVNENLPPIYISTSSWTKLYQICFTVDDPNANVNSFCPSLIWDLEANPANGGYLPGSDGVVMTVVNPNGGTTPVNEQVDQFNWEYSGNGTPPYGAPIQETCSSINCAPLITCPANITIACGASTLPSNTGSATATDLCNGDPAITYWDEITGGPCPQPSLISRTWVATDNCGNTSGCLQSISVGSSGCISTVSNTNNSGPGSLRDAIACTPENGVVDFSASLAGQTITITGSKILIDKSLNIRSNISPRIKINSTAEGLFEIVAGKNVEFKDLDITSGLAVPGNNGAAFNNNGFLKLVSIKVFKNPSLPAGQYLIRNKPASSFDLTGACFIEIP